MIARNNKQVKTISNEFIVHRKKVEEVANVLVQLSMINSNVEKKAHTTKQKFVTKTSRSKNLLDVFVSSGDSGKIDFLIGLQKKNAQKMKRRNAISLVQIKP